MGESGAPSTGSEEALIGEEILQGGASLGLLADGLSGFVGALRELDVLGPGTSQGSEKKRKEKAHGVLGRGVLHGAGHGVG